MSMVSPVPDIECLIKVNFKFREPQHLLKHMYNSHGLLLDHSLKWNFSFAGREDFYTRMTSNIKTRLRFPNDL